MISTLLIIDAMNLIRRIYAVQEKQSGETESAILATENTVCNALKKLLHIHQPTHVICVFDSHTASWRHRLYPNYKKGRKPVPALLKQDLDRIQDLFFTMGVESLVTESDEADDLIATLADKMAKQQQKCIIVSTDKGFYQLLNTQIIIYDYFQHRYTDALAVFNKMGLSTQQLCDYWAITGISSSAIKGVEGIGAKGALTLLKQFKSLDNMLLQPTDEADKRLAKIHQCKADALLTKKLVTLHKSISLGFNLKDLRYTHTAIKNQ
ncbi:flap endonuclease Xni [Psychromonas antarctica]|jgi:protein Xni|uniref:flap endonuclease Xni n=1 Tax=Psychromonas antarctica TaxID=67573 RepID=UPI001EE8009C|nr:flap endonuclease Xni [Psychromonas antarctica]MCG6201262.1 flap endonuclease Xni [Psychromonas antarctica]